ncbi:chloramphenicol phosphotransferase [Actinoplanes sp. ATCC 53533]|nr:chloramphenicol phosphotransferase [Actinoplanes sp. ATCC 53533]
MSWRSHPGCVEPTPTPRGTGRIILLNGASSSGKSTLAKSLRTALEEPFLHVSSDQFVATGMLPPRRDDGGPFDWWHQVRPRFFAGFHRCLPAFAVTGNDLIVEHVIEFRSWRAELAVLLAGLDVFLVGVHCAPDELDRRERIRGDRRIGEGRAHVELNGIHTFGPYDFEIDTTAGVDARATASVLSAWRRRAASPGALAHLRAS